MTDIFDFEKRRQVMRTIRGKNTKPEMVVRSLIHSMGYRYRLHVGSLPGCPDLVFSGRKKVIFVHGCFWHRHHCRKGKSTPKTRVKFWEEKLAANKKRDTKNLRELRKKGWKVLVVWECQTNSRKQEWLAKRVVEFLESK